MTEDAEFRSPLVKSFYEAVQISINDGGVYPHVAMAKQGDKLVFLALDLTPEEVVRYVAKGLRTGEFTEVVFGLDRYTKPGQGTEFADVLTFLWFDGLAWTPGVIDYQISPRIVRPINWDNTHWNNIMMQEYVPYLVRNGNRVVQAQG